MAKPTIQTRLCPHCANSITADALTCHYCKADLNPVPQWPEREDIAPEPRATAQRQQIPFRSKVILVLGLFLFALGVYLVGGQRERSDLSPVLAKTQSELQEKDQKIKSLEDQLADLRRQSQGSSGAMQDLKAKLAQSQKDLAAARKRLTEANREIDRLAASRAAPTPRPASRPTAPASSTPASRKTAEPGLYETLRPTTVFEEPTTSAKILNRISKGTQVTAVRSVGDWLEIRSKHGNPPGFIRADDATLINRGN